MSEVRADFNPKPGRLPPGHASTMRYGEEGDDRISTMRVGEAGELTMTPSGSESGEWYTTQAVGEEGEFTRRIGEAGDNRVSTMAVGEEGDDIVSTLRVGEEGDDPGVPSNPILLDPINTEYNKLLELLKKILRRLINNKGIGIGFPPIINPNPIDCYPIVPNPIVRDYTDSMPKIVDMASARIEHAYLPEAE